MNDINLSESFFMIHSDLKKAEIFSILQELEILNPRGLPYQSLIDKGYFNLDPRGNIWVSSDYLELLRQEVTDYLSNPKETGEEDGKDESK